ncbi:TIGR04219 family outer membrane beta-barrel protein [Bowmanella yangjiangensis]|uniref:TIGR04219 family outer membrane beta-barrel protein n=1 Tax=Bowmanella yangjiangensis TaxID=2811230 RepID=A0ABS3CXW4_9ALTE|nr:TIGR04219 family outer membrane beta-barrel protein [Bowmanella yangjiangensis]MBN7821943.1 TIGR04219 family outer membrane beta-barrel protein [Bowmanella yangjiangensis]
MFKKLLPLALCSFVLPAQADTLLGLYVGAQGWRAEAEGGFANTESVTDFSFKDKTLASYYVALEHPIPLIPNIRISRQNMETQGDTILASSFTFAGETFAAGTQIGADLDMDSTDYTLYYEIFDNDIVSFDLGITARDVDGVLLTTGNSLSAQQSFSGIVPLLYGRVEVGLPLTGLGVQAQGNFLALDDNKLYDYQAAITYSLMDNLAVDMTLQLGYRVYMLELDDMDDIYTDMEFKGVFAGVELHF